MFFDKMVESRPPLKLKNNGGQQVNFRKRLLKIEFQKVNFKNSFQKPSETLLKQIIYFRTGITQVHTIYLQSHRFNVRGPQKKIFSWLHFHVR